MGCRLMVISPRPTFYDLPMPKMKRTALRPVTEADLTLTPEKLRRTPTGWAWCCEYCGKFASSETLKKKFVCRDHGGTTPAQRDPVAKQEAKVQGRTVKRPPGRPLETGLYSKGAQVRIEALVDQYRTSKLDPDQTDNDMLYLRAYLEEMKSLRPEVEALRGPLQAFAERMEGVQALPVAGEDELTVQAVLELLERGSEWATTLRTLQSMLGTLDKYTQGLEDRHARLIALSKVRAETRLKNAAGMQLDVFTVMLRRLMVILREQLSPEDLAALQQRVATSLEELPQRALEGGVKA